MNKSSIIVKTISFFTLLSNNKKILENYFFMTILQLLNSFFYLFLYPFIITTLGVTNYGLYVFSLSISSYFIAFINFGFDITGVKSISLNQNNTEEKSFVLSGIFTAKIYISLLSIFIFILLLNTIGILKENYIVFVISFMNIVTGVLFPIWYFQGLQKMRIVTSIQIVCKLISLPVIILIIRKPEDINIFALIISSTNILGALIAFFIITNIHKIRIKILKFNEIKLFFHEALPYFWTVAIGTIKGQSISLIAGTFYEMKDVAFYDLAYKIVSLPNTLLSSLNGALFPKMIKSYNIKNIRKIIRIEFAIGVLTVLFISLFGKAFVIMLSGQNMLQSYEMSIILSVTVLSWLLVGAYINFILIPNDLSYYVTKNQGVALLSFIVFFLIGILFFNNVLMLVIALSLSSIMEIFYCYYIIKSKKLL